MIAKKASEHGQSKSHGNLVMVLGIWLVVSRWQPDIAGTIMRGQTDKDAQIRVSC